MLEAVTLLLGEMSNMIDAETIWKILGVVFICGTVWNELKAIRRDIARLEKKQDRYNNLQERTHVLEVKVERLEGEK